MRYIVIVGLIGVGVGLIAFGFVATGGDHLASFDPHHPATFLPSLENRLRLSRTAAGELFKDLAEGFIAPYREGFRHNWRTR